MVNYIITCRTLRHGNSGHMHVEYVTCDGYPRMHRDELVRRLRDQGQTAEADGRGGRVRVRWRRCWACGFDYLTTDPDHDNMDNLDTLPTCTPKTAI